ncbi:MAG: hypothetical protein ACOCZ5_00175 [bacterium]
MSDFTIEGRMKQFQDIQRNWMWQLTLTPPPFLTETGGADEGIASDLKLRCRSISIPTRGNTEIESSWMGMKQFFQGKPEFGNTLSINFEETEDQFLTKVLYQWHQQIFNIESGENGGKSLQITSGSRKRELSTDLYLEMFKYDGEKMDRRIKFINAWPKTVSDVPMSYDANESVKYDVTFQFDFWRLVD